MCTLKLSKQKEYTRVEETVEESTHKMNDDWWKMNAISRSEKRFSDFVY